jgi:N6-adenosine-specific RNA methylase IME4
MTQAVIELLDVDAHLPLGDFPSVPRALQALDRLHDEIRDAPTMAVLDEIAAQTESMQVRYRRVEVVANRAGKVWVEAETRLGQERGKIGKAKGTQGTARGRDASGVAIMATPENDAPSAKELGIAHKRLQRAERLAAMSDDERDSLIAELEADGKAVTPNAVLVRLRQKTRRVRKHQVATAVFSADGPFDVVVIDPPWPMQKIDRDERPNQDAFDYPTMTVDQIAAFWSKEMAGRIADDCHLFWWTTQKYLPATFDLIAKLGLRYVLTMVWHKPGGFQPHDLPQYNCEFIVYARRGAPLFIDTKAFDCCFEAPRREHSRKPQDFYDVISRVTGGSRIDVFSREQHNGFAQFGNETGKF